MKGVGAVLLVAAIAGLIAAVILLATDAGQDTDIGKFIGDNVSSSIDKIKEFLSDNSQ